METLSLHTSIESNPKVRQAFFAALREETFQQKFLAALQEKKVAALEVLKNTGANIADVSAARKSYLAAEGMLMAHHEGRSPEEKTEWLIRFIEDALNHAEGKPQRAVSGKQSILRECFEMRQIRPEDLQGRAKAALGNLEADLGVLPDRAAPATPHKATRRDLLRKAGGAILSGSVVGGVAGKLLDEAAPLSEHAPQVADYAGPVTIGMGAGAIAHSLYTYFTATSAVIKEKRFAEELGSIFSATSDYCQAYAGHAQVGVPAHGAFFDALKTNAEFRMAFLAGTEKIRAAAETVLRDATSTEDAIKAAADAYLASDSILNAYQIGVRDGKIKWLVQYLQTAFDPDALIERDKQSRFTVDKNNPLFWREDLNRPAITAIARLHCLVEDTPAKEIIAKLIPAPKPTRRAFLAHTLKGAAGGAVLLGSGALVADSQLPLPDIAASPVDDTIGKAAIGGALGALAGALYKYGKSEQLVDRKRGEAEITHIFSATAHYCVAAANAAAKGASR